MKNLLKGAALASVALLAACGGITPRGQVPQGPPPSPVFVQPSRAPGSITDGVWKVPGQVGYGVYKTTVPTATRNCFWERRKASGKAIENVVKNGNEAAGESVVIEIKLGDVELEVENCGTWAKIG